MVVEVGDRTATLALDKLIKHQEWDQVYERLESSPADEAAQKLILPSHQWTMFHWLCSMGSAPPALIALIASLCPKAIILPDNKYGDTPLHIICRNSQTQATKIKILLQHCPRTNGGQDLLIRNQFGGTILHSASNHNARLEALEAIVTAEPKLLRVNTHECIHAVTAMWLSYIQTIPGFMSVARILEGEDISGEGHFGRFWNKVEYLASAYFQQTAACPLEKSDNDDIYKYVLHGLIRCNVPINMFRVALKRNPAWALVTDASGNLPLHLLVENRPYRLKEKEAIGALLDAAAQAAGVSNNCGDTALVLGIRNKMPWENGLDKILEAATSVVHLRDAETGLYPFQLSAAVGGKVAVDTTYHLLCTQPDLLR
jgi:hypothetical protein